MTDDDLETIRQRKAEQLQETGTTAESSSTMNDSTASSPTEPIHVTDADHLAELIDRYPVVLADFYADWCGPCKMLEPIVEELAAETAAAVAKVDVDVQQRLAQQYGVRGVPTVVLFGDSEPVERFVGVQGKQQYHQVIEQYLP